MRISSVVFFQDRADRIERRSDMAMSNLLACERPSVRALIVKGDMIVDEENRNSESILNLFLDDQLANLRKRSSTAIMTRSRTRNSTCPVGRADRNTRL